MSTRVIVIGAGASGMMAAIWAAKSGASVTLLEREKQAGKKLAITGNGKCNLSNLHMAADRYPVEKPEAVLSVIDSWSEEEFRAFFASIGIPFRSRDGYLYPYSEQASQVVSALEREMRRLKVKCKYQTQISGIRRTAVGFDVDTDGWTYSSERLVIACGTHAGISPEPLAINPMVQNLGHSIRPFYPALTGLKCDDSDILKLAGLRWRCGLTVSKGNCEVIESEMGEVQFATYGISGIPTFCISHKAIELLAGKQRVSVTLDFLPGFSSNDLADLLAERISSYAANGMKGPVSELFEGLFPDKAAKFLANKCDAGKSSRILQLDEEFIRSTAEEWAKIIKSIRVNITGYLDASHAQVCMGGIPLEEIDLTTMESRIVPGLYFAGEILDVDGKCGGYNLRWAWTTGKIAGIGSSYV